MSLKKVCVVTAARSEYGLLRWLIDEIKNDLSLQLQLIVTGSHLLEEYGFTYKEIESDGYTIDYKVDMELSAADTSGIIKSMGHCMIGMADALESLQPDMLVVLGDRYELLSICSAALLMNIPIAHLSGGDVTEGAIDDQVRNAVTMMSSLHFPGVEDSANNIARMTNSTQNIHTAGEPGLDNFVRLTLLDRHTLAENMGLDIAKKWVLVTQHSETKETLENNMKMASNIIQAMEKFDGIQVVITKANADYGGKEINDYFDEIVTKNPAKYKLYSSLGQLRYLSFMKEAFCIIGNSSSGIVEAPYLAKPVINVGQRQTGRFICKNVVTVSGFGDSIGVEFARLMEGSSDLAPEYYYGDGMASVKIKDHIKEYLNRN
jgi:UDP-N-acetylglucosamine 2-epimerase (non-hydrolysing)